LASSNYGRRVVSKIVCGVELRLHNDLQRSALHALAHSRYAMYTVEYFYRKPDSLPGQWQKSE
jgi:hypothetical protein